jgi:ribosomal protein L11 methyltransferase
MDYIELTLIVHPKNPWTEIFMVELADAGYESFVETENGLLAYAQVGLVDQNQPLENTSITAINPLVVIESQVKIIPQQNWNAVWEADFQPVEVEEYLTILAPFHEKTDRKGMLVEILPKMSFGTGHHQTTWMMSKALFELEKMPKQVLDMGTGTGVLAIIAEKLHAENIVAVDIEDWSIENTIENSERNNCSRIEAICGDVGVLKGRNFGLILANINKNVLKAHMQAYYEMLDFKGTLLLSGFFTTDAEEIIAFAENIGFTKCRILQKDNWAAIELTKNN